MSTYRRDRLKHRQPFPSYVLASSHLKYAGVHQEQEIYRLGAYITYRAWKICIEIIATSGLFRYPCRDSDVWIA